MKGSSSPTAHRRRSKRTGTSPAFFSALRSRQAKDKHVLLEIEAINTFRGPAHILRGVTLEVGDAEVVSLVGRNGAGRTTIIESITGLLPVRSGRKRFRDAVMMIKGLGISLLLAESNLTSAAAIADRLYVVDRGEIIFHGTPPQALANEAVMRTLRG